MLCEAVGSCGLQRAPVTATIVGRVVNAAECITCICCSCPRAELWRRAVTPPKPSTRSNPPVLSNRADRQIGIWLNLGESAKPCGPCGKKAPRPRCPDRIGAEAQCPCRDPTFPPRFWSTRFASPPWHFDPTLPHRSLKSATQSSVQVGGGPKRRAKWSSRRMRGARTWRHALPSDRSF